MEEKLKEPHQMKQELIPQRAAVSFSINQPKEIDEESRMGHFGWPNYGDEFFGTPYILRKSVKYFAAEMIEMTNPLKKYLKCLDPDLYSYYTFVVCNATETEIHLLNDINSLHCDWKFGQKLFTVESTLLVNANDAYLLYKFLDTCYETLILGTPSPNCGFIRFNKEVVVPFVTSNSKIYMPMRCFESKTNFKSSCMTGWDFSYMKLCCKYQGIWIEPENGNSLDVIDLNDFIDNSPPETTYETYWPARIDHQMLVPNSAAWDVSIKSRLLNTLHPMQPNMLILPLPSQVQAYSQPSTHYQHYMDYQNMRYPPQMSYPQHEGYPQQVVYGNIAQPQIPNIFTGQTSHQQIQCPNQYRVYEANQYALHPTTTTKKTDLRK